jgi:glycerol-3-phosphate dehydrogenase
MMESYCLELGVKYQNNGALVVAYSYDEILTLEELKERGERNGVNSLEILNREELIKLEPNVSDTAVGALYAKDSGIVCPYNLTIAAIGNAMDNGAELLTDYEVSDIKNENGVYKIYAKDGRVVESKVVINASGLSSSKIASLVGDNSFVVKGRRGEYILLDRESGDFVSHTIFKTPTKMGKGILVSNPVDGNILLGPTAENIEDGSTITTENGLNFVKKTAGEMCKNVPHYNTITSFAGVRAYSDRGDFIIEESSVAKGFINVCGIESPGLTSAPAIAKHVVEEIVSKNLKLEKNKNFNPKNISSDKNVNIKAPSWCPKL